MKRLGKYALRAGVAALVLSAAAPSQADITFNFTFTPGTSVQAQNAFIAAGNVWKSFFSDNVTLDLTVGTASLGGSILGQAGSRRGTLSYANYKTVLGLDVTSANDATAFGNLAAGNAFGMLLNYTSNSPNGVGSPTPFLDADGDANNNTIRLTTANAKALGVGVGTGNVAGCLTATCDAFIQFNSDFAFDYDQSDGIGAALYDFTGVAIHEIGHAMGFISGVDILDINSTAPNFFTDNQFTYVAPLDLYRYSALSAANGVIDWTADNRNKYFSIDKGVTVGPLFSTGTTHGDGRQASHWKDNLGIGIMDPTAAKGEFMSVSANDTLALDVIGWNLKVTAVPEPASWAMMIAGFAMVGSGMRYRRRSPVAA